MVRCIVSVLLWSSSIMHWTSIIIAALLFPLPLTTFAMKEEDLWPDPPLPLSSPLSPEEERHGFISSTLGSNMVLQRDAESTIWGFTKAGAAGAGTIVITEFDNKTYVTEADAAGIWRQTLPAHPASLEPTTISVLSPSTGESATLTNILFGHVYLCGGQSNMAFAIPKNTNATIEAEIANEYPHIRLFTVGQKTTSPSRPLLDLQTIEQPWTVTNATSISDPNPKGGGFSYFSSVCWFFGRTIADGLDNKVPIGLISNNWGGTKIEQWSPTITLYKCKTKKAQGELYNAMIHPYIVGPMSLTGFAWYQGESNVNHPDDDDAYACLFPAMIEAWRNAFNKPTSYFGFVQLSTWCPKNALRVPEMRQAQMAALKSPTMIGYSTNADHGAGCNIHPPTKQFCGIRLGRSALALVYNKKDIHWQSPSYAMGRVTVTKNKILLSITLKDVSSRGLKLIPLPYNQPFDCTGRVTGTCAWASIHLGSDDNDHKSWVNATVSVLGKEMILSTDIIYSNKTRIQLPEVLGSAYGWGSVPMLNVYDAGTDLPVLPWNQSVDVTKLRIQS